MNASLDFGLHALRNAYRAHGLTVRRVIDEVLIRVARAGDDKVWITRAADEALRNAADALDRRRGEIDALPLFGIPFAVKDNIDVVGLPTTAACPGFSYMPAKSAEVVRQLVDAGAIVIGKTNLDQFATGLVGVRSPYGVPRNPFNADYIPGGSSSGSAVAVSSGLVSFSLGTDTAGSGRVPAGFNNIVGLKPTPDLLSNFGVVPACKSLDCVSVFALSCADADAIWKVLHDRVGLDRVSAEFRFGVPEHLEFFGDTQCATLYGRAMEKLEEMGGTPVEFDYTPFLEAAQLLYNGPFVAERTAAIGGFVEKADANAGIWPVTREIVLSGRKYSAVDTFNAQYRLAELYERVEETMEDLAFLALPTTGTTYTIEDIEREPILYNSNLGYYTNFVNFFRLSALALPAGFRSDGVPFGITLVASPLSERTLLDYGMRWQRKVPLPLGHTGSQLPSLQAKPKREIGRISIAVVGAHMSGFPLNGQLVDLGGRLECPGKTAPIYRLFALPGGPPQRPGMLRVADGGGAIELEVWSLPAWSFSDFVTKVPSPLSIGVVSLEDGSSIPGFLCESYATRGARDITDFGGWRAYVKTVD